MTGWWFGALIFLAVDTLIQRRPKPAICQRRR